jgi:urocanate hydratase
MNGIARRAWARNENALETAAAWNLQNPKRGHITLPYLADEKLVDDLVEKSFPEKK